VTVWLGLALGSIVGAYFVGFFSGRYVGFEAARESTAGEIAKLPVPEAFHDNVIANPGGVYDKLKSPAILRESVSAAASQPKSVDEKSLDEKPLQQAKSDLQPEAGSRTARIVDEDAPATEGKSRTIPLEDSSTNEQEVEQLFGDDISGGELIIGADEPPAEAKVPGSVRMLGSGKPEGAKDTVAKSEKVEKSASALLDERIASAKASAAAGVSAASDTKPSDKKSESGLLVRKVVPSGYFAQVAAPKKVAEAEAVAAKLKRSGFPVVIESASVAGQNFYRVLVGPEENKVQADRLVSQLTGESYISGKPFIRKVK
jgi:cell division septation protein DedD